MDERTLVERLIARDAAAWDQFLREYGPSLVRASAAVLSRAGSSAGASEAEDIAQKVLELLLERDARLLRSFQGRSTLSTWLIGIARRQALMHLRHERSAPPLPRAGPVSDSDPLETMARAENVTHLAGALDRLAPRERLILSLHYRDGLAHAEIASVIGVAANSVSPLLERARERLKSALLQMKKEIK